LRLLSTIGFFGENCIISCAGGQGGTGAQTRVRTMTATTETDLVMLRSVDVLEICERFPELGAYCHASQDY
jgi:hypothetical protein